MLSMTDHVLVFYGFDTQSYTMMVFGFGKTHCTMYNMFCPRVMAGFGEYLFTNSYIVWSLKEYIHITTAIMLKANSVS